MRTAGRVNVKHPAACAALHAASPTLLQTGLYFAPQQEMPHCQWKLLMILSLTCCSGNKL